MVFVPAGKFAYKGVAFEESVPERQISQTFDIAPFCIDLREVSSHDVLVRPDCGVKGYTQHCHFVSDAQACFSQEQAQFYCEHSLAGNPRRLPRPEEWLYAALGTDGRHFPWGSTWYPWGNHPSEGRPNYDSAHRGFCDFSHVWDQALREGGFFFNGIDCTQSHPSLDVSPFGVENMGSNVLEWTAPSCTVMGIQHIGYPPPEDPPGTLSLINRRLAVCDTSVHMSRRTNELVGFRCIATKKGKDPATDKN